MQEIRLTNEIKNYSGGPECSAKIKNYSGGPKCSVR